MTPPPPAAREADLPRRAASDQALGLSLFALVAAASALSALTAASIALSTTDVVSCHAVLSMHQWAVSRWEGS